MGSKNTYTTEFKQEAASLVLDNDYTITQASEAMGVSQSAMRRWVKQLEEERGGKTPQKCKAITQEQQQIQSLQKQVKRLEREKEILKKASALLMSDMYQFSL